MLLYELMCASGTIHGLVSLMSCYLCYVTYVINYEG